MDTVSALKEGSLVPSAGSLTRNVNLHLWWPTSKLFYSMPVMDWVAST